MERQHINNLIKKSLNIVWEPDISDEALHIIDKCDSTTEKLYLLGAAYYIEQTRNKHHGDGSGQHLPIISCVLKYNNISYEGLWFLCPWGGWLSGIGAGPSACAFVPQLKFPNVNYHHDFGLFYSNSDGGENWSLRCAIEIDPEVTHKSRRNKDGYRDSLVDYKVVRIYDETHDYLSWFQVIVNTDDKEILKNCPLSPEEDDYDF